MNVEEPQEPEIPVTILTGFLGAGKTTLLNRILKENHNHKIAIIENEFGTENVDNDLLVTENNEQIVSMNNGCVCCTIRGDLSRILTKLRCSVIREKLISTISCLKHRGLQIQVPLRRPSLWTMRLHRSSDSMVS